MNNQRQEIFNYAKNIFKPRPHLTGSQWADEYFMLSAESSSLPGKFICYPYQRDIIDCMTDTKTHTVAIKKATRIGYNKMLNITIGYFIDQRPASILFYNPTESEAKGVAESEIETMVRDNERVKILVENPNIRGRTKKERTMLKNYPGGYLEILSAESDRNFNRRTALVVIGDEIDTWKKEAGKAGDIVTTMMRRNQDFALRKSILGGKPIGAETTPESTDQDGYSLVDYWFKQGTQEHRYMPCPKCKHMQRLDFEDMKWDKDKNEEGVTIKHYPNTAHFDCKECGFKIIHKHKREMDAKGEWRAESPGIGKTRSFHVWAVLSYSPNVKWSDIVKEFLTARSSRLKLKAFTNEVLARTWEEDYEKADTSEMMERREEYPAQVPDDVLVLTIGADVQKDRIECEVIGWGKNYESWSIEYKKFFGDPTQPEVWETLREYIMAKRWYREDGTTMSVYAGCIDAGYLTDTVTSFCKPLYSKRIFPTQGHTSITAKINPGVAGRTKKNKNRIFTIGVNKAKDEIAWHIASKSGAGFMHFPTDGMYNDEYFKQLGAEKKEKNGRWVKTRNRNEVIDVRVYNYVALSLAAVDMELLVHRGAITNTMRVPTKRKKVNKSNSHMDEF